MFEQRHTLHLDAEGAWIFLKSKSFGRLAVSVDNQPEIYPVNFLADDGSILIRTEEGTKLASIDANPLVAFEVDDSNPDRAWSVAVTGSARRLGAAELAQAQDKPLWTWTPEAKDVFIRIDVAGVSGRLFERS